MIKHEEVQLLQKHYSFPILADYGTDQISIRINNKSNDAIVKLLDSFSFKSVTPFQSKCQSNNAKTHTKHNTFLHQ